jgi:hypothetical protein
MNTILKLGVLALVFSGVASSSTLAACLGEPSPYVLTCQSACCDSLKTACTNGHATYTPTKGGGGKCTVGSTATVGSIKSAAGSTTVSATSKLQVR